MFVRKKDIIWLKGRGGAMNKGCLSVSLAAILLAPRVMASDRYPTSEEIYMLELMNRFRANPSAEYARYGIATASEPSGTVPTDARPPLTFNTKLDASAYGYARNSHDNGWEGHNSDGDPGYRITREGYTWSSWAENLAYGYTDAATEHQGLLVDATVPSRGHRMNILSTSVRELGIGIYHGSLNWVHYYVQDFARADSTVRLCGVVYDDLDQNRFYGVGEGLAGASLILTSGGITNAQTASWSGGAYVLTVPGAGAYTLSASGGGLPSTIEVIA